MDLTGYTFLSSPTILYLIGSHLIGYTFWSPLSIFSSSTCWRASDLQSLTLRFPFIIRFIFKIPKTLTSCAPIFVPRQEPQSVSHLSQGKMVCPRAMQFHVAAYLTALGQATTHLFIPSMSILILFLHAFPSIWNFSNFPSALFQCILRLPAK